MLEDLGWDQKRIETLLQEMAKKKQTPASIFALHRFGVGLFYLDSYILACSSGRYTSPG